jgi:hypothetical protein|eukprot:COSAG01_NODE_3550_length_5949_cov_2.333846_7_plen_88_part_00
MAVVIDALDAPAMASLGMKTPDEFAGFNPIVRNIHCIMHLARGPARMLHRVHTYWAGVAWVVAGRGVCRYWGTSAQASRAIPRTARC